MADGNLINVTLAYAAVSHNENLHSGQSSRLPSKFEEKLKPYTLNQTNKLPDLDSKKPFINTADKPVKSISTLASLISNPVVLARVERNPSLRAAILSNPSLADVIMNNPALLTAIIKNPGLLTALTKNFDTLLLIKGNPAILSEIIKNPSLSIESVLEKIAKNTEAVPLPKAKNNLSQVPHPLEKSTIAAARTSAAIKTLLAGVKFVGAESLEVQKQQASQVLEAKILEVKTPIKSPAAQTLKPTAFFDARLFAINPALLALLGAAAMVSNRGRVTSSGSLKDIGVELETQSETQPDAIQESDQVEGVGEVGEIHSISEASI